MKYITFGNSKLKRSYVNYGIVVGAFDLPAGKTCPRAGKCLDFCYASTGMYGFPAVRNHCAENHALALSDAFVDTINAELAETKRNGERKVDVLRIHSSGDFFSEEYCNAWADICDANPGVTFYAYSKSWKMVESSNLANCENFTCIPSMGGKDDAELAGRPCARVVPEGYEVGSGEALGDDDDMNNLSNFLMGNTICLEVHGARKGRLTGVG
jgi:Gene product 88